MNNVTLIGRLTKDPEVRYAGESPIANFTLAIDRHAKEKTADFIRIVAFGKTAELCERFLAKGRMTAVQGRIQTGSFKKSDGTMAYTTEVVADRVEFLEWPDKDSQIPKEESHSQIPEKTYEGFAAVTDDEDNSIPF